jgi:hypothetical protein
LPRKVGVIYPGNYWTASDQVAQPGAGIHAVYTADQMRQFRAEGIAADRRAREATHTAEMAQWARDNGLNVPPQWAGAKSQGESSETRMDTGFHASAMVGTAAVSPQAAQGVKTWQERCGITRKPHGQVEEAMAAEIADLRAQLAHKTEAARRWESKLDAVWANLCRVIEQHTGRPVDGEPLDALSAQLARQSQGGQSMINRWLELIRVWIADPMRTDYVSVNKKYLRDMASDFEFSINGSTDAQARVADLARKLIECYPDTLPSLYVDGEPVGKELVAAVRALYAAPPLSSEQQAEAPPEPEVRPCDMPACSGVSRETGSRPYCPEHREAFEDWRRERARKQQAAQVSETDNTMEGYLSQWRARDPSPAAKAAEPEQDPLYEKAAMVVRAHNRASISLVQRTLFIGYNRAARLLEAMEKAGVVSVEDQNGRRTVLMQQPEQGEPNVG